MWSADSLKQTVSDELTLFKIFPFYLGHLQWYSDQSEFDIPKGEECGKLTTTHSKN